jgi:hypothetical protein|tara:strand:+ start:24 stop:251 length:228 start_codon:yes stop_codon:yes gene_type:complete
MKIEKEELDVIVKQQMDLNNMLKQIGLIEAEKKYILSNYSTLLSDSNTIKKELEDKYGAINIDLSDGSYVLLEQD